MKKLAEEGTEQVEIVTEKETVSGRISEVGKDYVGIIRVVEQKETRKNIGQNKEEETQETFLILELEILIRFQDIISMSRVERGNA